MPKRRGELRCMHEVYFVMFVTQMKKPWNVEMQKKTEGSKYFTGLSNGTASPKLKAECRKGKKTISAT